MRRNWIGLFIFVSFLLSSCSFWDSVLRDRIEPYEFVGKQANQVLVKFHYYSPSSSSVWLVGDFNDWNEDETGMIYPEYDMSANPLIPMTKDTNTDIWSVTVPLETGRYLYKYVLDKGRVTVYDSNADLEADGFGGYNSVIMVLK